MTFLKIKTGHPKIFTKEFTKIIVSNQKEESISIQRVNTNKQPVISYVVDSLFNVALIALCLFGFGSCFIFSTFSCEGRYCCFTLGAF